MTLSDRLADYIAACFTALGVQSHEHEEALREIAAVCGQWQWRWTTWDIAPGLSVAGGECALAMAPTLRGWSTAPFHDGLLPLATPPSDVMHRFRMGCLASPSVVLFYYRQRTSGS